jgi:6-phosphogluconate dehydrogenase
MERLRDLLPGEILLHPSFQSDLKAMHEDIKDVVVHGIHRNLHLPCHSAALQYFNGTTIDQPTGNLIQAQRDYFCAHGFKRIDDAEGKVYHGDWGRDDS